MSWMDYFLATPPKPPASGRNQQEDALGLLHAAATGQTPSAADAELRAQTARNVAGAYAIGNTLASRNPGAAARTAATVANDANATATEQGIALRAREQQMGQQQFMQGASQVRAGDLGQEDIDQKTAASENSFLGGLFSGAGGGLMTAVKAGGPGAAAAGGPGAAVLGDESAAALPAAALSDRRAKTDVHPGEDSIERLLDALSPEGFRYRDARDGQGPRIGVIAQDAQRGGPVGRSMVDEDPSGRLRLDPAASISAALAAVADLHERLKRVEQR